MKKKKIWLSHNDYFQKQFQKTELAVSFLKEHLPEVIADKIDWSSLKLVSSSFIGKALRNRKTDILYQAKYRNKNIFFFVHLEHQRTSPKDMSLRMLFYTGFIWQHYREENPGTDTLPFIYPIVIYQGRKPWTAPRSVHEFLQTPEYLKPYCPELKYDLLDLSALSDEEIKGDILQRLILLVLQNIDSRKITELLFDKYLPLMLELLKKKRGVEYIEDMLYYLSYKSKYLDREVVIEKLNEQPEKEEFKEVIMTLAEQWKQEGREEGREEGRGRKRRRKRRRKNGGRQSAIANPIS